MIDVINLQRKVKIDTEAFRAFTQAIASAIPETAERSFSVAFIGDNRMTQLNELFRDKKTTTDVLSFPHEPDEFDPDKTNLGDIVVSADQAQKQATENGVTLENEIKQLILHGLLHLCGFDHETDKGEMNMRELQLRNELRI